MNEIKTSEVRIDYSNIAHLAKIHAQTYKDIHERKKINCFKSVTTAHVYLITKANTLAYKIARRKKSKRMGRRCLKKEHVEICYIIVLLDAKISLAALANWS